MWARKTIIMQIIMHPNQTHILHAPSSNKNNFNEILDRLVG